MEYVTYGKKLTDSKHLRFYFRCQYLTTAKTNWS